jgi:hypothetical protein
MAKKHKKKCSPFLAIKEMQIKTTVKFHLTPVRRTTTNVGEDVGEKGTPICCCWECKLLQLLWKILWKRLKN